MSWLSRRMLSLCALASLMVGCSKPTDLASAVQSGDARAVETLLQGGLSPDGTDSNGEPYLSIAMRHRDYKLFELLLSRGADPETKMGDFGSPALIFAVEELRCGGDSVSELLSHGASPNVAAFNGTSIPILEAAKQGLDECVEALLSAGANPNTTDSLSIGFLYAAALGGDLDIVVRALQLTNSVNALNIQGSTPLHAAAAGGYNEVVDLLLEHGADKCITNSKGKTAAMTAIDTGHPDTAAMLSGCAADPTSQ